MRFKLAAAAIAAGGLALGGVTLASADSDGQTIKLFTRTAQAEENIDLGSKGFSLGDQLVFSDDVYNKKGGTKIGFDGGVCTIVRVDDAAKFAGTSQCIATLHLADGDIASQGLVTFHGNETPPPFDFAITGGTDAYKNASGFLTVDELNATDANLTLHLSAGGSGDS
jgi:hypothetical protein